MLTIGSLFAGIGGFDLGFERAGFKTVWQVEINEYCRKVLARHFPDAERYADIRECGTHNLKPVDVICGGFPCQDISNAGLRAGIDGERSGLWREMHRVVRQLRPRYVVVENVAALLQPVRREPAPISRILGDLADIRYCAEWQVVSAADAGAPHLRERVWIVAYPDTESHGCLDVRNHPQGSQFRDESLREPEGLGEAISDPIGSRKLQPQRRIGDKWEWISDSDWWRAEPAMDRVAYGVPNGVDRIAALGNAVVPQIPELIARRLKEVLESERVRQG